MMTREKTLTDVFLDRINALKIPESISEKKSKLLGYLRDPKLLEKLEIEPLKNVLTNPKLLKFLTNPKLLKFLTNPKILQDIENPEIFDTMKYPKLRDTLKDPELLNTIRTPELLDTLRNPEFLIALHIRDLLDALKTIQKPSDIDKKIAALTYIQKSDAFQKLDQNFINEVNFILDAYERHLDLANYYHRCFFEFDMPRTVNDMKDHLKSLMKLKKTDPKLLSSWYEYEKDLINHLSTKNLMDKTRNKLIAGLIGVCLVLLFFLPMFALPIITVTAAAITGVYVYNRYKASQKDMQFRQNHPKTISQIIENAKESERLSEIPEERIQQHAHPTTQLKSSDNSSLSPSSSDNSSSSPSITPGK